MSIYIEGLDMPQDGMVRSISIEADGSVRFFGGSSLIARAVEVPPHGALGDLDALAAKDNADYEEAINCALSDSSRALMDQIHESAQMMLRNAETIIPADPAKEEPT